MFSDLCSHFIYQIQNYNYLIAVLPGIALSQVNAENALLPKDAWNCVYNIFSSIPPIKKVDTVSPSVLVLKDDKPLATEFRRIRTPKDLKELDDKIEGMLIKANEEEIISKPTTDPWWHVWKWNVWKHLKSQNTSNLNDSLSPSLQAKLEKDPELDPDTLYMVPVKETKSNCTWWRYIGSFFSKRLSDQQYIVNNGTLFNPPEDVSAPFKVVTKYTSKLDKAAEPPTLDSFRFTNLVDYYKNGKKKGNSGESYAQYAYNMFYEYWRP